MIDSVVKDIPNAKKGFRLLFSGEPFPGHQHKLKWLSEESGGNWYKMNVDGWSIDGWICPALFRYFDRAPQELFIKVEALRKAR